MILFHTQARGEEIMRMRKGDIQEDESPQWHVWHVRNDKRCQRGNQFEKTTEKVVPSKIASLIDAVGEGKQHGELLFDEGYCLRKLAELVKLGSVELQWPEEVRFLGPHGLRHGGTRPLMERAVVAVALGMSNQSHGTLRHYAKRNPAGS
jgi:integrase